MAKEIFAAAGRESQAIAGGDSSPDKQCWQDCQFSTADVGCRWAPVPSSRHRRRVPGVRTVLALVALLPLIGLVALSTLRITEASHRADELATVDGDVDRVNELFGFAADLTTEQWWATATVVVAGFGVPLDLVDEIVGFDIVGEYETATQAVDGRLNAIDLPEARAQLDAARIATSADGATMADVIDTYVALRRAVEEEAAIDLVGISAAAGSAADSGRLANAIDVLGLANGLRNETSELTSSLFGIRYGSPDGPAVDAEKMLQSALRYQSTLQRLEAIADPSIAGLVSDTLEDDSVASLFGRVDQSVADVLRTGVPTTAPDVVLSEIDTDAEGELFLSSIGAVTRHVALVDAAATEISEISRRSQGSRHRRAQRCAAHGLRRLGAVTGRLGRRRAMDRGAAAPHG